MKRYKSIFLVLFSILTCQSEIDQNENTNGDAKPMSFYAGIEIPKDSILTKTILDGSPSDAYRNVLWEYQDEVYVTNGSQSAKFINTSQGTSEIALLEGQLAEGGNYFAAYPFDMVTESSSSSFTMNLPSKQTYYENGIGSDSFPMVAQCEDGVLNFKNICGVLVVQLLGEQTIKSIAFSGKDIHGNYLPVAGSGIVKTNYSDVPTLVMNNSSKTSVTLSSLTGVKLSPTTPTSFHIVLPVEIYNSFELNIAADDGSRMILRLEKELNIKRSMRTTAMAFEFVPTMIRTNYIDEYGIDHGPGVMIGETIWAPVNCGYHATDFKYGKLYQWGRRYGQGYNGYLYDVNGNEAGTYVDSSVPIVEKGGVSLVTGNFKSKSNVFFTGTFEYNYDWVDPQDNKLWNSGTEYKPIKTEYDPCPKGWRVPTYAELDELNNNYSYWTKYGNGQPGCWFTGANPYAETVSQVFFPAAGSRDYRSYDTGSAYSRGDIGLYWSSRPTSTYANALLFYNSHAGMVGHERANGYSIRCVQE